MARKSLTGVAVGGVLAMAGQFVCLPVFAESDVVDIEIIEVVDDGSGEYKSWEDIVGAMPGETYSAIPRVKNNGTLPVLVRMCVMESAVDDSGKEVVLQDDAFKIDVGEGWSLDGNVVMNELGWTIGNCYKYHGMVEVGEMTEPLFTWVTLNEKLGNKYENNTFSLHLVAEASSGGDSPAEPDTGFNTASYFDIVSPVLFSAGWIMMFAVIAYIIRRSHKKD